MNTNSSSSSTSSTIEEIVAFCLPPSWLRTIEVCMSHCHIDSTSSGPTKNMECPNLLRQVVNLVDSMCVNDIIQQKHSFWWGLAWSGKEASWLRGGQANSKACIIVYSVWLLEDRKSVFLLNYVWLILMRIKKLLSEKKNEPT